MDFDAYCQEKAAQSRSSFYYSFLFLPQPKRRAIMALYAFCREVDDVVDEIHDPGVAAQKLAWWRGEIGALSEGQPTHPITRALQPHLNTFSIEPRYLLAIIDGMEMDLQQSRYLDYPGLERYCWHVASAVGILAARTFSENTPATQAYAEKLGLALQLTNIIRDIGEDARRGRIYLPIDELQRFDVKAADILASRHSEKFVKLMQFQAERAHRYYDEAFALLPREARRAQRPGLIMAAIYRDLLREIERDGFLVLDRKTKLTSIRKLWLAWTTWIKG